MATKPHGKPHVVAVDDDEDERTPTKGIRPSKIGDVKEEEVDEGAPPLPTNPDGGVGVGPEDLVSFACFEDVAPAPVIGRYNFMDHGVTELKARETYQMPRITANWLVERKKGAILSK